MKFILLDYVNEAGWPKLAQAEQIHWTGAPSGRRLLLRPRER